MWDIHNQAWMHLAKAISAGCRAMRREEGSVRCRVKMEYTMSARVWVCVFACVHACLFVWGVHSVGAQEGRARCKIDWAIGKQESGYYKVSWLGNSICGLIYVTVCILWHAEWAIGSWHQIYLFKTVWNVAVGKQASDQLIQRIRQYVMWIERWPVVSCGRRVYPSRSKRNN